MGSDYMIIPLDGIQLPRLLYCLFKRVEPIQPQILTLLLMAAKSLLQVIILEMEPLLESMDLLVLFLQELHQVQHLKFQDS